MGNILGCPEIPQIYILWIFLCYLLGSLNRGLKTVNPPSLNVEICKLSTVKEFSSESTTIFLNYVADCASKKRQSSKIAYKAVHISYYMTASKGLLSLSYTNFRFSVYKKKILYILLHHYLNEKPWCNFNQWLENKQNQSL